MRSLSSTVTDTPSSWVPSRRVVSKISTASGRARRAGTAVSADMLDPVLVAVDLAPGRLAVHLLDGLGHRPRARDGTVVHRVDRCDLGGGAAQEHLLGHVEVASGEV